MRCTDLPTNKWHLTVESLHNLYLYNFIKSSSVSIALYSLPMKVMEIMKDIHMIGKSQASKRAIPLKFGNKERWRFTLTLKEQILFKTCLLQLLYNRYTLNLNLPSGIKEKRTEIINLMDRASCFGNIKFFSVTSKMDRETELVILSQLRQEVPLENAITKMVCSMENRKSST